MDWYGLARPLLHALPPESAHLASLRVLDHGLGIGRRGADDPILASRLWDRDFPSPIGLAAGFDKDCEAVLGTIGLGFGFVEVGTITPRPQPGNPRPRLFRLWEDEAVINRLGFNGKGLENAVERLKGLRADGRGAEALVGVNVGKNRDSSDAADDYARAGAAAAPFADYLVINVSSPNTAGLRELQRRQRLMELLGRVREALSGSAGGAGARGRVPPLLVKIAPDLSAGEIEDIAAIARSRAVDGLIVGNSTTSRPEGLRSRYREESGGLTGRPLFELSTRVLSEVYRLTDGRVPLIGCGGVFDGRDAYRKVLAGASLVQLYTALVYRGPLVVGRIKTELAALLRRDGFTSLAEAVGAEHRRRANAAREPADPALAVA
ncbi:MAG: quinone-dependent dihydroorotate dehydrogenase [Alphaproteobacteria bacterium]